MEVIHVTTAVINRKGATNMTSITKTQETAQATASAQEPKATTKAGCGSRLTMVGLQITLSGQTIS
jgi:hypothetical protein